MLSSPPDSWIERHWMDAEPSSDPCGEGVCWHATHCDGCGRPMPGLSESGFCFACEVRWNATHQLTWPDDRGQTSSASVHNLISQGAAAGGAEANLEHALPRAPRAVLGVIRAA